MSRPRVRVVGLGPGDARHLTARSAQLLSESPVVRLRTAVHPAAATLTAMSYDDWYERAESFDDLYHDIVEDLARLAHEAEGGEVVYAVPGSPVVAERDKLIGRHPHVFGDAEVADAAEVEARWEELKRTREGRQSVLEGVVWHLPALALYAKLLRKARAVGAEVDAGRGEDLVEELVDLCRRAAGEGVDLESALRARALVVRDEIVRIEDRAPEDDDTRG